MCHTVFFIMVFINKHKIAKSLDPLIGQPIEKLLKIFLESSITISCGFSQSHVGGFWS